MRSKHPSALRAYGAIVSASIATGSLATAAHSVARSPEPPVLNVIHQLSVADEALPKWCYGNTPEFIFFDRRSLVRARLDGTVSRLAEIDRSVSHRSLACSADGRTIFFLSTEFDRAYIYQEGKLSEYAVTFPTPSNVRYGALMSPDGSTFALPPGVRHLRGEDVLKSKRILPVDTTDVFWTSRHVIHRSKRNVFHVLNRGDLKLDRPTAFPSDVLIDGIYECTHGYVYLLYSDEKDDRHLARLTPLYSPHQEIFPSVHLGSVDASADGCVVSIVRENAVKLSILNKLVFITGEKRETADVSALGFLNDAVSVSKDQKHLVTFQTDLTRSGGKIVIFRVDRNTK